MLFVSDVHGAIAPLAKLVAMGETVVVLGDLANLTDYRDGEGAVAEVLGIGFARESAMARASGDYEGMRSMWTTAVGDRFDQVRSEIGAAIERQYVEVRTALQGGHGLVIHGNVDRPSRLSQALPGGFRYVHGEVVEVEGARLGLVGGGAHTPLRAEGEISDEDMEDLLTGIGPVDVLCTHVPPAIRSLRHDVVTGREERGSAPILEYLRAHQPRFHFFGDIHQAQASTWRVGSTRCFNAGYFRATGRYLRLEGSVVSPGRVG